MSFHARTCILMTFMTFMTYNMTNMTYESSFIVNISQSSSSGAPPSSFRPSLEAPAPEVQSPTAAPVLLGTGRPGTMENDKKEENEGFV